MNAEVVGRRMFVGSLAAAMPAAALWTTGVAAQGAAHAHLHGGDRIVDPVFEQLLREMAAVHNAARSGPRGEHARALAAHLRLVAAHGRANDLDGQVRSGVAELVAQHGRDGAMYLAPDRKQALEDLTRFGVKIDDQAFNYPFEPDYVMRSTALATLEREGLTPLFDRLAARLDRIAPELDNRLKQIVRIQDADYWEGYCTSMWGSYTEAQTFAGPVCAIANYLTFVSYACSAAQLAALVLFMAWAWNCGLFS
jgi:hypothetical protein